MKVIIKLEPIYTTSYLMLPATPEMIAALAGIKIVTEQDDRYVASETARPLSFALVDDVSCTELTAEQKLHKKEISDANSRWYNELSAKQALDKRVKELEQKLADMTKEAA